MNCIICIKENPITNSNPYSREHIFPEAIGGSLILENKVCKKCNSQLGAYIDHPLVNHPLIKISRNILGIKDKKGFLPQPLEQFVDSVGRRCVISQGKTEEFSVKTYPIKKPGATENQFIYIPGDEDKSKIIEAINKLLKRNRQAELNEESIAEIYEMRGSEEILTANTSLEIDIIEYQRGIIKIVYELAAYWLGENYLYDPTAVKIRQCIRYPSIPFGTSNEHWSNIQIEGQITNYDNPNLAIPFFDNGKNSHIAFLMKVGNRIGCWIKIFNVFKGVILVSENPEYYRDYIDRYIQIDAQAGYYKESLLSDEIRRIADIVKSI